MKPAAAIRLRAASAAPGQCVKGTWVCAGSVVVCANAGVPTNETCDNADNDCDGTVDNIPTVGGPCVAAGSCSGTLSATRLKSSSSASPTAPPESRSATASTTTATARSTRLKTSASTTSGTARLATRRRPVTTSRRASPASTCARTGRWPARARCTASITRCAT